MENYFYRIRIGLFYEYLCVLALLSLVGCGTSQPIMAKSIRDIRSSYLIEEVPFYVQEKNQCGPSSLASVLNFYGADLTPDKIAETIFETKKHGTLTLDMVLYARGKGYPAQWYSGKVKDIIQNIDRSRPLIVLVDLGLGHIKRPHFMVIIGYDQRGIFVNSGTKNKDYILWQSFLKRWKSSDCWTLKIEPKKS